MFRFLNRISNVDKWTANNGFIYYTIKGEEGWICKFDMSSLSLVAKSNCEASLDVLLFKNENLFSIDMHGNGFVFDSSSLNLIDKVPEPLKVGDNHIFSEILTVYQGRLKNREFGMYSFEKREVLWMNSDCTGLVYFGSIFLFGQKNYELFKVDPKGGVFLWKNDLKAYFPTLIGRREGVELIGLSNNCLLVSISSEDKLIALNSKTGKLIWEMTTFPRFEMLDNHGFLHSLTVAYIKTDAATGKQLEEFADRSYFDEVGILSQRGNAAIVGDHLITTDYEKGRIGAFNTKTFKFDWVHDEPDVFFPSPRPIIYEDPYLLLQDNMDTLHIFKKE